MNTMQCIFSPMFKINVTRKTKYLVLVKKKPNTNKITMDYISF